MIKSNSKNRPTQFAFASTLTQHVFQLSICLGMLATANAELHAQYNGSFVDIRPVAGLETPPAFLLTADDVLDDGTLLFSLFNGQGALYEATRESIHEPFNNTTVFDELNQAGTLVHGQTMSTDGLTVYFLSSQFGSPTTSTWKAERENRQGDWSNLHEIDIDDVARGPGDNAAIQSLTLSSDDMTMYYSAYRDGTKQHLYQIKRETTDAPFGEPEPISELNEPNSNQTAPTVSSDGLAIMFSTGDFGVVDTVIATRSSTDEPFGDPIDFDDFGLGSELNSRFEYSSYPVISPNWPEDGSKLYFTGGHGGPALELYEATWNLYAEGDADVNGEVNFADFLILSENFGQEGDWQQGDFDGNGQVDFPDFLALSANFGNAAAAANASAASVPEPTGLSIALLGLLGLIGFRKRR